MINVNANEQVIYVKFTGRGVLGSVLIGGGKDQEGKAKPNGFMNVNFSGYCADKIYDMEDLTEETKAIKCNFKGFLVHNEYGDVKEEKIIVTDIDNLSVYVKDNEEKKPAKPVRKGAK